MLWRRSVIWKLYIYTLFNTFVYKQSISLLNNLVYTNSLLSLNENILIKIKESQNAEQLTTTGCFG